MATSSSPSACPGRVLSGLGPLQLFEPQYSTTPQALEPRPPGVGEDHIARRIDKEAAFAAGEEVERLAVRCCGGCGRADNEVTIQSCTARLGFQINCEERPETLFNKNMVSSEQMETASTERRLAELDLSEAKMEKNLAGLSCMVRFRAD